MAQTGKSQASAQKKWANEAMGTQRTNEKARTAVAPKFKISQPVGATSQNTPALRKKKLKVNMGV